MNVVHCWALESNRDDLAGLCIVAQTRSSHGGELLFDDRFGKFQQRRDDGGQGPGVGAVADDHVLAVYKSVGTARIGRVGERHGKGSNIGFVHLYVSVLCKFGRSALCQLEGFHAMARTFAVFPVRLVERVRKVTPACLPLFFDTEPGELMVL